MSIFMKLDKIEVDFTPADPQTGETKALINVSKGDMVIGAFMQKLALAADADTTAELGDGGSTARFVAATDLSAGSVGDLVNPTQANIPHVYTAADTIDVKYTEVTGDEANTPKVRFVVYILRVERPY